MKGCNNSKCTLSTMMFAGAQHVDSVTTNGIGLCDPEQSTTPIMNPVRRLIAIGDIHGDLKLTLQSLVLAKVIPYNVHYYDNTIPITDLYKTLDKITWIGEDTYVVQVGDQIDRCRPWLAGQKCSDVGVTLEDEPSDIIILNFFTYLDILARKHGGRVISLLGNHELLNLAGKMTYVSKAGLDQFKETVDSEGRQITSGKAGRKHFFRRGGKYSQFLACSRFSAVIIGSTLFAHAGIIEQFLKNLSNNPSRDNIVEINNEVKKWILGQINSDNIGYIVNSPDSLFWTRILGGIPPDKTDGTGSYEETCVSSLDGVLNLLGLDRMIIGHTPFINQGVSPACNNKLFRVDTGASRAFKSWHQTPDSAKPKVLEIINDHINKPEWNILE